MELRIEKYTQELDMVTACVLAALASKRQLRQGDLEFKIKFQGGLGHTVKPGLLKSFKQVNKKAFKIPKLE